jgi:hypothetical protein
MRLNIAIADGSWFCLFGGITGKVRQEVDELGTSSGQMHSCTNQYTQDDDNPENQRE